MFDSWQSSSESDKEFKKEPEMTSSSSMEDSMLYQKKNVEKSKVASLQAISITSFNTASEKCLPFLGLTLLLKGNGFFFMVTESVPHTHKLL